MPSRVIRGEINASRSLSRVSLFADLTFRALLVYVDDFGRCEADPLMLKAGLFPRRPEVTPETIAAWVEELEREGCVRRYAVDGVGFLALTGWERHRSNGRRAASSKFPEPPEHPAASSEIRGSPSDASEIRPSGVLRVASSECRVSGGGVEGGSAPAGAPQGPVMEAKTPDPAPSVRAEKRKPRRIPGTLPPERLSDEDREALRAWAERAFPPADWPEIHGRLRELEATCLDHFRAIGEIRPGWLATARNWLRVEARRIEEREQRDRQRGGPARAGPSGERPQERGVRTTGGLRSLF